MAVHTLPAPSQDDLKAVGHLFTLYADVLPTMTTVIALHERLGFEPTAPCYAPTPEGTVFLRLKI
jgi:hypothetical protein